MATLDYYLSWIPSDQLDRQIDDKHRNARGHVLDQDLGRIADEMPNWEGNIATVALGLAQAEITAIQRGQYQGMFNMQR